MSLVDEEGRARVKLNDGTSKFVQFNSRAVRLIEKELDINFLVFFDGEEGELKKKLSFTVISTLLWAGIKGAAKKNTFEIDDVVERITLRDLDSYIDPLFAAIKWAMVGDEEETVEEAEEDDPLRPTEALEETPAP